MDEVLIVAAEASSCAYAEKLLNHWQKNNRQVKAFGVGSQAMEKMGFERLGRSEEMGIVGLVEVIKHYPFLKGVFNSLVEQAKLRKPKFAIVMDYPDFNLRLAKELKKIGIPVVYYISPQVWVWRQGRVKQIKEYCDAVLCLFPFEKDFYDRHGVAAEFVGHPLLDDLQGDLYDEKRIQAERGRMGFSPQDKILAIMPGSRFSELKLNFPTQLLTAKILVKKYPKLKLLICVAPTFSKEDLHPYLEDFSEDYVLMKDDPNRMISLCHFALVTSGTATLMVGLLHKPMVVMYKFKALTAFLARRLITAIDYFCLVNLIMNKELVPERFQEQATPEHLAELIEKMLIDEEYYSALKSELMQIEHKLGDRGATIRVAKYLERYFHNATNQ